MNRIGPHLHAPCPSMFCPHPQSPKRVSKPSFSAHCTSASIATLVSVNHDLTTDWSHPFFSWISLAARALHSSASPSASGTVPLFTLLRFSDRLDIQVCRGLPFDSLLHFCTLRVITLSPQLLLSVSPKDNQIYVFSPALPALI